VKKLILVKLIVTGLFILLLGAAASAQVIPTPKFTAFYDDASTYNGDPLAIGTIIKAYDPDGVLCGMDTVHTTGEYGYMSVYGDDDTTPGIDEGAVDGDTITFEINGRPATVIAGDPTFTDMTQKQVELSASPTIRGISLVDYPTTKAASFSDTVRFLVGVRNDGDGLDYYGVSASNSLAGFTTLSQTEMFYAESGDTVYVYFEIETPVWPGADTVNHIQYTVYSMMDPSMMVQSNVDLIFTITDVDDPVDGLPYNFALQQNYPNPFNPSTMIAFSLPARSEVDLQVINMLGRVVDEIDLGTLSAGDHQVDYHAGNLASGVYFYRIVTDRFSKARKMILLK